MKYLEKVLAEMFKKYQIDNDTLVNVLPKILSDRDWHTMSAAMKYPNGKLVQIREG